VRVVVLERYRSVGFVFQKGAFVPFTGCKRAVCSSFAIIVSNVQEVVCKAGVASTTAPRTWLTLLSEMWPSRCLHLVLPPHTHARTLTHTSLLFPVLPSLPLSRFRWPRLFGTRPQRKRMAATSARR
jgi:hypothetical protein